MFCVIWVGSHLIHAALKHDCPPAEPFPRWSVWLEVTLLQYETDSSMIADAHGPLMSLWTLLLQDVVSSKSAILRTWLQLKLLLNCAEAHLSQACQSREVYYAWARFSSGPKRLMIGFKALPQIVSKNQWKSVEISEICVLFKRVRVIAMWAC